MEYINTAIFSASVATATINSSPVRVESSFSVSAQAKFSAANSGTLKLQFSNDVSTNINESLFVPTNWSDLTGATVTPAAATIAAIQPVTVCAQWIRAVWTPTAGAGTFSVRLNAIGN